MNSKSTLFLLGPLPWPNWLLWHLFTHTCPICPLFIYLILYTRSIDLAWLLNWLWGLQDASKMLQINLFAWQYPSFLKGTANRWSDRSHDFICLEVCIIHGRSRHPLTWHLKLLCIIRDAWLELPLAEPTNQIILFSWKYVSFTAIYWSDMWNKFMCLAISATVEMNYC